MLQAPPVVVPKSSPELASRYIARLLPDYVELLKKIEKQRGQVQVDPRITQCLENLNISDYAKFYQEGDRLTWLIFVGLVGLQAAREFSAEVEQPPPQVAS